MCKRLFASSVRFDAMRKEKIKNLKGEKRSRKFNDKLNDKKNGGKENNEK